MNLPEDWPFEEHPEGKQLRVRVIPRASRTEVAEVREHDVRIRLQAPPVDQKANRELLQFLAKTLHCKPRDLTVIAGEKHRSKTVLIGV